MQARWKERGHQERRDGKGRPVIHADLIWSGCLCLLELVDHAARGESVDVPEFISANQGHYWRLYLQIHCQGPLPGLGFAFAVQSVKGRNR